MLYVKSQNPVRIKSVQDGSFTADDGKERPYWRISFIDDDGYRQTRSCTQEVHDSAMVDTMQFLVCGESVFRGKLSSKVYGLEPASGGAHS